MEERIQKILARTGLGSRRACEKIIAAGRVRVNGITAELGAKADPQRDRITVDGRPIKGQEKLVYIALHKPRGVLSTTSSKDTRPTVLDMVDVLNYRRVEGENLVEVRVHLVGEVHSDNTSTGGQDHVG